MNGEDLLDVAERLVAQARPGEELEVVAAWSRDTEVRAYEGEVEHFVSSDSLGIGIRVIQGGRQGLSWAGELDESVLSAALEEARDNSRFGTPDPNAGLAQPDGVAPSDLDLFDYRLEAVDPGDKIALAIELERMIRAADQRIVGLESADYADSISSSAIASSTGIRSHTSETSAYIGAYALAGSDDETTAGFGFSSGRSYHDLSVAAAAADAVDRCVSLLGANKVPSSKLTVVLHPYVTSQFLGLIAEMLSAEAVIRGRSPFADRLGEQIGAASLSLFDDAINPLAPTASRIDDEGLACRRVPLIEDGALVGYLHNAYTARSTGGSSTGSAQRSSHRSAPGVGPHVATLAPGDRGRQEILAMVGDGLMVNDVAGLHSGVNPVSGDFSVGAEGFMIRNGELAEPVKEITIGSTLQRMLADVTAVGSDLEYFPWESSGVSLAVDGVTMSGL